MSYVQNLESMCIQALRLYLLTRYAQKEQEKRDIELQKINSVSVSYTDSSIKKRGISPNRHYSSKSKSFRTNFSSWYVELLASCDRGDGGNSNYSYNNQEKMHFFQWFPCVSLRRGCPWLKAESAHSLVEFLCDYSFEWGKQALVSTGHSIQNFLPVIFTAYHIGFLLPALSKREKVKWLLGICMWVYLICSLFSNAFKLLGHFQQIWQWVEILKRLYSE